MIKVFILLYVYFEWSFEYYGGCSFIFFRNCFIEFSLDIFIGFSYLNIRESIWGSCVYDVLKQFGMRENWGGRMRKYEMCSWQL